VHRKNPRKETYSAPDNTTGKGSEATILRFLCNSFATGQLFTRKAVQKGMINKLSISIKPHAEGSDLTENQYIVGNALIRIIDSNLLQILHSTSLSQRIYHLFLVNLTNYSYYCVSVPNKA
jgi:hypothetical protein